MTRTLFILSLISLALSLPTIHVTGNKFFDSDGNRFYIKGVDYQPSAAVDGDPLADTTGLNRDIPYLTALGINMIRVYSISADNHDEGMKLLEDAGIYVLLDATEPRISITTSDPKWNMDIFSGIQNKISKFTKYTNLFGFICGNEVLNTINDTIAAPYVKASVRDVKSYIKSLGSTALVGYAATDNESNDDLQPYMDCLSLSSSVDFYGVNTYRWCNGDTYDSSGYASFTTPYNVPVILSEYGCQRTRPRLFDEVQAIFGSQMNAAVSGGFAFQYSEEANGFGLVKISGNTVTTLGDYDNLKKQYTSVTPAALSESSYTPATANLVCPTKSSKFLATPSPLPPTPSDSSCTCMYNSLSCVVKSSASVSDIQSAVSTACGSADCSGISTDSASATYGQWSGCSSIQAASFALNQYYTKYQSSQGSTACDFGGVGQTQTATPCSEVVQSTKAGASTYSKSASQTKVVSETSVETSVGSDGQTQSVTVSQTAVQSVTESSAQAGNNKYQSQWNAAFSSASIVLPTLVVLVAAIFTL